MEQIISKEELEEIMKIKGSVRGAGIKEVASFVLRERGKKGLKQLEDTMVNLGYPIRFGEIKTTQFYPLNWYTVLELVTKRLFGFDDKKLQEMGRFNASSSLIIRFLIKYLVSLEMATKKVSEMWRRYYTVGELRTVDYDKEKKYVILRLEDFAIHPLYCQIFIGYFATILKVIVKSEVTCRETKCPFRGDEYHEFLLEW